MNIYQPAWKIRLYKAGGRSADVQPVLYVLEDGVTFYVTEDLLRSYITEND